MKVTSQSPQEWGKQEGSTTQVLGGGAALVPSRTDSRPLSARLKEEMCAVVSHPFSSGLLRQPRETDTAPSRAGERVGRLAWGSLQDTAPHVTPRSMGLPVSGFGHVFSPPI